MIKMSSNDGSSNGGDGATLKKGPWSAGEDAILIDYVRKHGEGNWNAVQRNTALQRCGKSCRLRWANHLRPNLKKGAFSFEEERLIIELHSKLGNKWARISSHLPGRTDNEIKNYWNTRVKRRLRSCLPLYPTNFPINRAPPSPQPVVPPQQPPANLPMFDPVSFSSSPLFSLHQPPPFMFSQPIKNPNPFLGQPVSSPSQLGQIHPSLMRFGFDSDLTHIEGGGLGFSGLNFELPSNQVYQKVNINNDCKMFEEMKSNANLGRTNSGLLNDLLEGAREKVRVNGGALKERNDCGLVWDISSYDNSFPGIKKKESEQPQLMNSMVEEDLSSILELIPSLVQVPSWSDDGGGRESSSVGQSSVISGDDNNNNGLDQPPQLPSFGASSSTDFDVDDGYWNPGSDAWDNMPKIC